MLPLQHVFLTDIIGLQKTAIRRSLVKLKRLAELKLISVTSAAPVLAPAPLLQEVATGSEILCAELILV